ncbi:hypothetical protein FMUND_1705 [Fusarium mundagurra]|uniref:Uncharacterized protein n=1 Tax=Fusarium mundagurra TaxID=1567541 RepID=A0A8H6DQ65_9HYPO|nr:hypothetical protein FMUND_1705 [Fusarium mundagurra]
MLLYTQEHVEEVPRTQSLHLQALFLEAEIMSARGQYLEARDRTWDLEQTVPARGFPKTTQDRAATLPGRLHCAPVPQSDELFVDSRQNLAKCYMASAEVLYDRERRKYEPKGPMRTALAVKTIQHILEEQGMSLTLGSWYCSKIAWWMTQRKGSLNSRCFEKTRPEIEGPEHRKVEVLIRREIATAHMKVLYQYKSREKRQRKTDPRFKAAAKALEAVWKELIELLSPENAVTLTSLRSPGGIT